VIVIPFLFIFKDLQPRNIILNITPHILMVDSPLTDDLQILIILNSHEDPRWSIFSVLVMEFGRQNLSNLEHNFQLHSPHING